MLDLNCDDIMFDEERKMIKITNKPISPEKVVKEAKTSGSGCVVTYVGLIQG